MNESNLTTRHRRFRRIAVVVAIVCILAGMIFFRDEFRRAWPLRTSTAVATKVAQVSVRLDDVVENAISVEPEIVKQLGVKTDSAVVGSLPIELRLAGSLTLDTTHLQQVRSRFAGEVVELGTVDDGSRAIQFGDSVVAGQLLAVVWSRELGEKKSELIDALSQLHLDSLTRDRLAAIVNTGAVPGRELNEVERAVETDRVAVNRVRRTLQTWRVVDDEIAAVETEAKRLVDNKTEPSTELTQRWARVEIRAAIAGTILEQNVAIGDLVSPADDLFKVADLGRLRVLAYAYEEDLPRLDSSYTGDREWNITIPADPSAPPTKGVIEQIGKIIDPTQHTALVMGWVANPNGRLRAGQFVSASVQFPPPGNEVVVPATAIIEKGDDSFIFVKVQVDPVFARRRVAVSRQVGDQVCVLVVPPPSDDAQSPMGLQPDEVVVISGAVELQQSLTDLQASQSDTSATTSLRITAP